MNKAMIDSKMFLSNAAAGLTVFFSSACIMILELAAGRLAARQLGASLYTWTAVIGITLAGITIGNYIGGRIADRGTGKKVIADLFAIASVSCVGTIALSNCVDRWLMLWHPTWPVYVFSYITILFLLPSVFLGATIPVAIKAALEKSSHTGGTVGRMYALGSAGSILGTFLSGFFLIPAIGYEGVIWSTSASILIVGLIYSPKYRLLQIWTLIFVLLAFLGISPGRTAEEAGSILTLRSKPDPNVIYEDETQYCYIRIKQMSQNPDKRVFIQDLLSHSYVVMDDITDLQYPYERIYAAVTEQASLGKNNPAFLAIGGGGFVFPRYLKHRWPADTVDVAEIDPGVTKAAKAAFGLPEKHGLNIFTMDGRNFIDGLIAKKHAGQQIPGYDVIYGDAFDNFTVPYQLVTRQFNEKVAQILNENGFYMLNLIDIYESGLVVGSVFNTLQQTFGNVYVFSDSFEYYDRSTFVLIASRRTLDTAAITAGLAKYYPDIWQLSPAQLDTIKAKCGNIILTDDYAPVDNLAAPVTTRGGTTLAISACIEWARKLSKAGQWNKALNVYMKAVEAEYPLKIEVYTDICEDLLAHHEYHETVLACQKAIQYYDRPEIRKDLSKIYLDMGLALKFQERTEESKKFFNLAIEESRRYLEKDPNSATKLSVIGMAKAATGSYSEATGYFRKAINIAPSDPQYRFMLIEVLIVQKKYAGAQAEITAAIDSMKQAGNTDAVLKLQQLSGRIQYEGSQTTR